MNDNEKLISEGILDLKEISSLSMEYLENILDPFLDEVTSAIPIVGVIKGLAKTGTRIRERHFLRKTLIFMKQLDNNLDEELMGNFSQYREQLINNHKDVRKELERVLFILDKTVEEEKSVFISNAFFSYINKHIDRQVFLEIITILDSLMVRDLSVIRLLIKGNTNLDDEITRISMSRLIALGLVNDKEMINETLTMDKFTLTKLGKYMAWFMLLEGTPNHKLHTF